MKTDDIRNKFLDFFASKGAKIVQSDSLVPQNDPTLLFTGAGMNQFKDQFMGLRIDYRSATSCQKCLRTGDIMNVGVTPAHHTMFEMLGNFSFGGYFKKEAITWAWEFLTKTMNIPVSKLQVSVHDNDQEAYNIWANEIGLEKNKINKLGDKDNFWPADAPKSGPNGPCGPCSEIFYDRGEKIACKNPSCGITCDCRRWVEIWNLVFTQFDRQSDGTLIPLPQKNIDTGMGLERMAAVMQGVDNNMDIDIFIPITQKISEIAHKQYGKNNKDDILIRRIADHIRAVVFCIADGVMPANSHRGYVLKRLLRRAVLDGRNLGIKQAFLAKLVPIVAQVMNKPYPEIQEHIDYLSLTVDLEENKFLATLDKGLNLITQEIEKTKQQNKNKLSGYIAFELYDTYGFPYELAEELVVQENIIIDKEEFTKALEEAKIKAREGAKMKGDVFAKGPLQEVKKISTKTNFLGYDKNIAEAKVLAIVANDQLVEKVSAGEQVALILDQTTFYAEQGGQVGDTGILIGNDNTRIKITDTQKMDDIFLHIGEVESGVLKTNMSVTTNIDIDRRVDIRRNHTVTHLLYYAIRTVLGEKIEQKGSYVGPEKMRFDFQQAKPLTEDEKKKIEEIVNQKILEDNAIITNLMPLDEAKKTGAIALFGEKYGENVRVLTIGDFSSELCAGTHLKSTAPIGQFKIINEEAIGAGIRRVEGITALEAYKTNYEQSSLIGEISKKLKITLQNIPARIEDMLEEIKSLEKQLAKIKKEQLKEKLENITTTPYQDIDILIMKLTELNSKELVEAADIVKSKVGDNGVAVLLTTDNEKVTIVVTVGKALAPKKLKAGDIVRELAKIVDGGGGGKPDIAQAGGKNIAKIQEMLEKVPEIIGKLKK